LFSPWLKTNRALFLSLDHRFQEAFYLTAEVLDFCEGKAADLPVLSPADERELISAGYSDLLPYVFRKNHLPPLVNGQDGFKPAYGIRSAFAYGGFEIPCHQDFLFFTIRPHQMDLCFHGNYKFSDKSEFADFGERRPDLAAIIEVTPFPPIDGGGCPPP
jgi:hypothetical protein